MSIEEISRGLYIFSLISVIVFGIFMTLRYRPALHSSLSQALVQNRSTYVASAFILTLLAGALFLGLMGWFVPYHSLPEWTIYITVAILILIVLLAWLPTDGDASSVYHKVHFTIGGVLGICMIILVIATIFYSDKLTIPTYWIATASVAYCAMCYFLYLLLRKTRQWFLAIELVALGSILLTLLLLAY